MNRNPSTHLSIGLVPVRQAVGFKIEVFALGGTSDIRRVYLERCSVAGEGGRSYSIATTVVYEHTRPW